MLELYDSKFIITTDDGKLINCYSQYEDARTDAQDIVMNQNIDDIFIFEQVEMFQFSEEFLQKNYRLKEKLNKDELKKAEEKVEEAVEEVAEEEKVESED